jgi:hypothetical protein
LSASLEQYAQAVADGDARRHDEERIAEPGVLWVLDLVEGVPRNQHRHHDGLAGARGHLEGEAVEAWVGGLVRALEEIEQVGLAEALGALRQVDRRLDGFYLTEEQAAVATRPLPVVEQLSGRTRDARVARVPPSAHEAADLVDVVVLAQPVFGPLCAELELRALLLGLRDRNEIGAGASLLDDLVGDAVIVELEVLAGFDERRVDDRVLDDGFAHALPPKCWPDADRRHVPQAAGGMVVSLSDGGDRKERHASLRYLKDVNGVSTRASRRVRPARSSQAA